MSTPPNSPAFPVEQEYDVPTVPFPESRRRRLNPINTTVGHDEPIHMRVRGNTQDWDWYPDRIRSWIREEEVPPLLTTDIASSSSSSVRALPPFQYPYEQVIAAFVARMDREIRNMRDAAGEITSILQQGMLTNQRITTLTASLAATDTAHEHLANGCVDMEDRLNTVEWNLDILNTRIEQVDARLAAVEEAGVAPEVAPAADQDEDDDAASDVTSIMSGRGNGRGGRAGGRGGRGNINMTAAELTTLINERVAEAVAATHAAVNAGGQHNHQQVCTFKAYMDCKPHSFSGAEGAVGLLRWMEKSESAFAMCNCPPNNQVKYASGTLEGSALTWWNAQVQMLTLEMANALPWDEFKTMLREEYCPRDEVQKLESEFWNLKMEGSEIEAYTTRSHELANLCPQMVTPPYKRIEKFIDGLVPQIQSMVTSSNPTTIQQAIRLAHRLTDQAVIQGILPPRGASSKTNDNKRKFDNSFPKTAQSNPPSQQQQQQYRKFEPSRNNNNQSNSSQQSQGSYNEGHFKKNCPQLRRNGNGNGNGNNHQGGNGNGNNHQGGNGNNNGKGAKGRAFVIGSGEARNDRYRKCKTPKTSLEEKKRNQISQIIRAWASDQNLPIKLGFRSVSAWARRNQFDR
ncbi:hypothetical protein L1987_66869 [Smallanthus sonchifolius]|uniref:Uncharacterized protein n=1 Tax=Smallanthus sonchifolius TaxID=185202 RepID=A0ACB9BYK1_9ASTR|nr:hypothetical protein L1987_66869 [Smallanthus sonchifolius]